MATAIIDMIDAGVNSSGVNNTTPAYIAMMDYFETDANGTHNWFLTIHEVKRFWEVTMCLSPKHINALREQGIVHPINLSPYDSDDFDSVVRSMKGKTALPGLAQIRLKQACDFFRYALDTGRTLKNQYLTAESMKSYAIQFKAIKDSKDSKDSPSGLPKLSKSTDILAWMDRVDKTLWKLPGQDYTPLAYLTRSDPSIPVATDDFIPNKCYSATHKSLVKELVARKSHSSSCFEADKILLYDYLDKALSGGPLESVLQAHEDTKDGQAVMSTILLQHEGKEKWEKAHEQLIVMLKKKWKSTGNIILTEHIAVFRCVNAKIVRACKHTGHTPRTEREKVLLILNSINTTDSLLQAHVSNINGDPSGRGSNFEDTTTHLMLVDPVEKNQSKQSNRKISVSSSLAGRGSGTGVDLRWYPNWEYKKLDEKEKKELGDWRKTPAGESAMKKSREDALKRKKHPTSGKGKGDSGDSEKKRHKKFEKAVNKKAKAIAKDIVASAVEAQNDSDGEDEKFQAKFKVALAKSRKSEISAASAKQKENSIEQEEGNYQNNAKLSSVKLSGLAKRINKAQKNK